MAAAWRGLSFGWCWGCSDCLGLGVILRWFQGWGCRGFRACGVWVCLGLASGLGVWFDCWLGVCEFGLSMVVLFDYEVCRLLVILVGLLFC